MHKECETGHSDECGMSTFENMPTLLVIENIHCDHNNQPGMNDFDDRPKKGKKGKYL